MDLTSYPVSARLSASLGWAAAEYDELGQDEFLARYGFGRARAYLPIIDDKTYDSKAVLGAVYKHATGRPLGPEDFSGRHGSNSASSDGVPRSLPGVRSHSFRSRRCCAWPLHSW